MNAVRARALEEGLTAIARKVYSCVPYGEHWPRKKIIAELFRQHHVTVSPHIIDGCLGNLQESGLVRRIGVNLSTCEYRRVFSVENETTTAVIEEQEVSAPQPQSQPQPQLAIVPPAPAPEVKSEDRVMEMLSNSASDLRKQAAQLLRLADEIDEAAIAAAEEFKRVGKGAAALKQLRALMDSV